MRWPALGLAAALLLTGAAFLGHEERLEAGPRVVMIGVRGLSWRTVSEDIEEGRLPFLAGIVDGEAAVGDIIAEGYRGEEEILVSIVSGRLPFKVGGQPIWDELNGQGLEAVALGSGPEAERMLRDDRRRHIFLFFQQMENETVDDTIGRLVAADGGHSTFFLFSPAGLFLAWGGDVTRSVKPHMVAPVDLAPTLLHVAGARIPIDMDGLVLFGVFDESFYFKKRLAFRP